jgi:SAM-dependent methyltransferase
MYLSRNRARVSAIDNLAEYSETNPWLTREIVKSNLQTAGVNFSQVDLAKNVFPFADNTFDLVLCQDVIEHLPCPRLCLTEIRRVLRDDGVAFIGFPNGGSLRNRVLRMLGRNPLYSAKEWYFEDVYRGHIYEPTIEDIPFIFKESRLQISKIIYRNDRFEPSGREKLIRGLVKNLLYLLTMNRRFTHSFIVMVTKGFT